MATRLVAIVGPTASGKSALALRLAHRLGGEIVSCDSLQVYRGLDIGSAKPTARERAEVPHHLIDVVEPDQPFSAADYARLARSALAQIAERGHPPIVVGGTGLYLRALLSGLFEGPSRDAHLRGRLTALAERHGDRRLHRLLARVDPEAAGRIESADRVRMVRALEVFRLTGRTITEHHRAAADPLRGFEVCLVGLAPERAELRRAVERRAEQMLAGGLLEEARGLLTRYGPDLRPLGAIGYRQAVAVLQGRLGLDEAPHDMVVETMRYAKRQMTWFRRQAQVSWHAHPAPAEGEAARWLAGAA